ncbi:MAG: DNA-protecting protein DprA [Candidatus Liptonbacteria bacterium CG11_big_fil_rev_8_21_14_0_20_35_14]|uniref:DNA-protecting protein DprA n=1 Tax=Candidatus Liptonbacteria bacterium CG11_big_fil_rev_8_21_14_0_20_35_14 TaxID=1974634 RepID=A0A2H0N6U3_9BACT|nr:MAG: DNA-protecting protein DprA [Candidatus Liptonbacteria bacterium CG11_big_fil_rev_8_21_14_0_20_35_14]
MFREEQIYYNAINIALNSNFRKIKEYLEIYGSFKKSFEILKTALNPFELIKDVEKLNVRLILYSDEEFPKRLKNIPDSPIGLYVLGEVPSERCVAIVGTRKPSKYGEKIAYDIAKDLAKIGFGIVSGLAYGIDTKSHFGAIKSKGKTWAILANGLAHIYPKENRFLAQNILENKGGIMSEYPILDRPIPYRFLERNRIISGLSEDVIIIEAPQRSGSISTARHTLEQGGNVYVVPGEVYNINFKGSHELIRDGARLITSSQDLLDDMGVNI